MKHYARTLLWLLVTASLTIHAADVGLIIVEDRGGVSALPYYRQLDLPSKSFQVKPPLPEEIPATPILPFHEADMLPARSSLLSPGIVERRTIHAPGLKPLFLVGDDNRSQVWLRHRAETLRALGAVGLVVNVDTVEGLANLRRLAPGLHLSPVSADDLARRLGLNHYPVLITASGIEQ